jgi:hypothetical protein
MTTLRGRVLLLLFSKVRLQQIGISRQNKRLDLWQPIQRILGETQVIPDNLLGRQTKPLCNRDVVVNISLKDLCIHSRNVSIALKPQIETE